MVPAPDSSTAQIHDQSTAAHNQRLVEAFVRQELIMGALLLKFALVEHHDLVGVTDRRQTVRNHNRREALLRKQNSH